MHGQPIIKKKKSCSVGKGT